MQGVIKSYDPVTGDGVVLCDRDLVDYELAEGALADSLFRVLRQGQRVVFDIDESGFATALRLGSERDMATPALSPSDRTTEPVSDRRPDASIPPTSAV